MKNNAIPWGFCFFNKKVAVTLTKNYVVQAFSKDTFRQNLFIRYLSSVERH